MTIKELQQIYWNSDYGLLGQNNKRVASFLKHFTNDDTTVEDLMEFIEITKETALM